MAVTFIQRSAGKRQSSGTGTISLAPHASAAAGDLQMLAVSAFSAQNPTVSGSWTTLHSRANTYSRLAIFVRVLSSADLASNVDVTVGDYSNAELRTYRPTAGEQFVLSGSGDGLVCADVSVTRWLVRCWASAQANTSGGSAKTLTPPAGLLNAPASTSYNWYDGGLFGDDPTISGSAGTSTAVHGGGGETISPQWANVLIQTFDLTGVSVTDLTATPFDGGSSITWTQTPGATGYDYRVDGGTPVGVTSNSATIAGLTNGTAYNVEVRPKNATSTGNWTSVSTTPSPHYDDLILAAGPVFYAPCQESAGTTATDASPTAQNGSYAGGVTVNDTTDPACPAALGRHVRLDGTNGHLSLPTATAMGFAPATAGFTFEGWFYIRSWANWARIFDFANALSTGDMYFAANSSGTMNVFTAGTAWTPGRWDVPGWKHIAVTITPSGAGSLYVNNQVVGTGSGGALVNQPRQYMCVGKSQFPADPYLAASFTRVAIYNKVLTPAQIEARYVYPFSGLLRDLLDDNPVALWTFGETSGTRVEDYGAAAAMTLNGGALRNQEPVAAIESPSTLFDGVDDYGEASTSALNLVGTPWQVEAFIVPTTSWATLVSSPIATHSYNGSGLPLVLGMGLDGGNVGKLQVGFFNGGWRYATYTGTLDVGMPYHIVGTWDGTTLRLRINDVEVASNVPGSAPTSNSTNVFRAMRRWDNPNYVPGRLSHLAIYRQVLPAARTTSHYTKATTYTQAPASVGSISVTPIDSSLVVQWSSAVRAQTYEYRVDGGAATSTGTARKAKIDGLTNGTSYTIEVRAVNPAGAGDWTTTQGTPTPTTFYDDFARADSTTSPGTPVQGGPYTVVAGTWGISSGALYASASTAEAMMTFPGLVDLDFTFTVSAFGTNGGVMFRWIDANNTWLVNFSTTQISLWRRTGGTWVQQGNTWAKAPVAGDVIRLLAVGRTILVYRNGVQILTAEDHYFNLATATVGFRLSSETNTRLDEAVLRPGVLPTNPPGDLALPDYLLTDPGYDQGHLYKGRDTKLADQGAVA